jgi:hypothetical protein
LQTLNSRFWTWFWIADDLNLANLEFKILNVILNSRRQVHLEPLKETDADAGIYYRFFSSSFSPFLTLFLSFCPPLGHPFEVSSTYSGSYSTTQIQGTATKVPPSKCISTSICHSVLQLEPLSSSSSLKHQPFITIHISNYCYYVKSLA